jgi:hypothetical protein
MTSKLGAVIQVIDSQANYANGISAADQVLTGCQTGSQTFNMVNASGQLVATVTGAVPFLAPINIQTSTFAATTAILKISSDLENGQSVDPGDVLSLVGDVAGVIGTIAVFASAAPEVIGAITLVGVAADIAGLVTPSNMQNLATCAEQIVVVNWPTATPPANPDTEYLTNTNQIMTAAEIQAAGIGYGVIEVTPTGTSLATASAPPAGTLPAGGGATDGYGDDDGDDDGGDDGDGGFGGA